MRKIIGYIKNLVDGEGPPDGTVDVHALPEATITDLPESTRELDLTKHTLGKLDVLHLVGGSGSITLADTDGRFGWNMELSPGPIRTEITPHDPQIEHRLRLPDESAQVGKAFHSDIERLGWTAGKDCLIWGAIEGGNLPAAGEWTGVPKDTGRFGDWGIESFGPDPGKVTIRPGIAFLGGVLFSVEAGNLVVPVAGATPAAASSNGGVLERWDLLALKMSIDTSTPAARAIYGKQSFHIQEGSPGGGIPALTPVAGSRLLLLHALKMVGGSGVYSEVYDLRPWREPPKGVNVTEPTLVESWYSGSYQGVSNNNTPAEINGQFNAREMILPLDSAYAGAAYLTYTVGPWSHLDPIISTQLSMQVFATGSTPLGPNYVENPKSFSANKVYNTEYRFTTIESALAGSPTTLVYPIRRIPSGAEGRNWHRIRFALAFGVNNSARFGDQTLMAHLWPVP